MTKIILTLVLNLITLIAFSQNETNIKTFNVTVSVQKTANDKGEIYYSLFNKETFLKVPQTKLNSKIVNGKSTVTFKNVPVGTYAVVCFHDSNDNKKMDFNANGMPAEDYGTTNNIMSFGPPQFVNAKFEVKDKDLNFDIKF